MKTPDFTAENLLGAIVNMGADPFIVETEEQAAQVAESINNSNGYDILTGDDLSTAREQLDCPGARKVYAFVDGSGFIVCLSQDWDYMKTMQDLADYINDCEDWPTNVEAIIEQRGWVSDCDTEFGICHNDAEKVIINDDGEAVVVPMEANPALDALLDAKRQLDVEGWWIPTNDKGSGSAGVNFLKEGEQLDAYIRFAMTGDNTDCPNTESIEYIPVADFGEVENEVLDEIMEYADTCGLVRDEVLGFIVCHEYYDMDYTFFITHIKE